MAVKKRMVPIIGSGAGYASMIHIADAASATVAAIEGGAPGIYNVVDDEPAPATEWIPALAEAVGAKPPRRFPRWFARLLAGEAITTLMIEGRGASNAKARRELGGPRSSRAGGGGLSRGWPEMDEAELEALRPRAFAIAYRMLGSVAEAEDVVQEAMLRFHREIADPPRRRSRRRRPGCPRWSRGWRSTSCARRAPGARSTSASGCRSRSSASVGSRPATRRPRPRPPTRSPSLFSSCSRA